MFTFANLPSTKHTLQDFRHRCPIAGHLDDVQLADYRLRQFHGNFEAIYVRLRGESLRVFLIIQSFILQNGSSADLCLGEYFIHVYF